MSGVAVEPLGDRVRVALRGALGRLEAPTDGAALAVFRVAIGLLVAVSSLRFFAFGWIDEFFVKPRFFFKYWGFSWVPVPDRACLHALFGALVVLGGLVAAGLFYRAAIVLLFFAFAWVQLLDATNYLNHYYLVSLLLGLLALMPLGRCYGLDGVLRPSKRRSTLPTWMTWLLRFQVACVYVYAGKAKFGADWLLHAEPLNIWLASRTQTPIVGALFGERWVAFGFSWAGFLFDSTVVAFLLWRKTRPYAYVVVLGFHAMTMALFPIGMFPVIMVVSALVFFSPSWPRRLLRGAAPSAEATPPAPSEITLTPWNVVGIALGVIYCTLQVTIPLRHHLYGGNVLWHEQGMRFSWKVMVREKNASVTYWLTDRQTGRQWYVRPRDYLDARQEREFGGQPDFVLQLAQHIARSEQARGRDVSVRAEVLTSLNGRPPAALVDEQLDLTTVTDGVTRAGWILSAPTSEPAHLRGL